MNRYKKVKNATIIGIIGNIFLLIIKTIIGFLTNSQAMIADAINSAGDIMTSFMSFIGNRIANKPHDKDHNLGHGKAEYIYSMLISIIMMCMRLIIFKKSIFSIFDPSKFEFSIWLIIVCVTTIIIKSSMFFYTRNIANKYNNLLLKANSKDHRNDCLLSSLNLLSCILSLFGIVIVDSIVGALISLWILISALKIFLESYDVLMDKSIDDETKKKVLNLIKEHQEIKKITHFNSTPVGYRYQISFSIFVDGNLTTFESHKIADELEKEISKNFEEIYLTVIHVNPI